MFRIALSLILVIAVSACAPRAEVSERVGNELRRTGSIDLAKLTDFDWDTVYIFSPYTARKNICDEFVSTWVECKDVLPGYIDERNFLLVFTMEGNIAYHEFHSRRNGDYSIPSHVLKLPRAVAKFQAVATGTLANGETQYVLSPKAN